MGSRERGSRRAAGTQRVKTEASRPSGRPARGGACFQLGRCMRARVLRRKVLLWILFLSIGAAPIVAVGTALLGNLGGRTLDVQSTRQTNTWLDDTMKRRGLSTSFIVASSTSFATLYYAQSSADTSPDNYDVNYAVQSVSCGWPSRCLSYEARFREHWAGTHHVLEDVSASLWRGGIAVPASLGIWPAYGRYYPRRIPLSPIWLGLALNTCFYFACLLACFSTIACTRWLNRFRLGRCPQCGYSLKGTPPDRPCGECGSRL